MGRESSFQSTVLEYLNSLPGCRAENVSGNASQSGRPDITGCYKGRMFKLELKVPEHNSTASRKQGLELRRWKNAGCVTGVIYTMEAIKHLFSQDWETNSPSSGTSINLKYNSWWHIPDWYNKVK